MYGMYPNGEQWRINLSFIALALLGSVGYFATDRFKKIFNSLLRCYLSFYCILIYFFLYYQVAQYF